MALRLQLSTLNVKQLPHEQHGPSEYCTCGEMVFIEVDVVSRDIPLELDFTCHYYLGDALNIQWTEAKIPLNTPPQYPEKPPNKALSGPSRLSVNEPRKCQ